MRGRTCRRLARRPPRTVTAPDHVIEVAQADAIEVAQADAEAASHVMTACPVRGRGPQERAYASGKETYGETRRCGRTSHV